MAKNVESEKLRSKKDQTDDEFDDEDGGLKPKPRSKVPKKTPQQQPPKTSKPAPIHTDEEDEDGSFNSKTKKEHKQKVEVKKIKDEPKKKTPSPLLEDSEDEDGSLMKPKNKVKETKSKKKSMLAHFFHDQNDDHLPAPTKPIKSKVQPTTEDEDEDGGLTVKDYSTIKKVMSSKLPILKSSSTNNEPSSDKISDNTNQSVTSSASVDLTVTDKKVSVISAEKQEIKPNDSDPVHTEETKTKPRKLFTNKLHVIRRNSYEEAQNNSTPIVSPRPNQNNTNDDHKTHSSKIENKKLRIFINNLVSAISLSNSQQTNADKQLKQRKNRAQTRWYLAYTIIRNPSLRELRKHYLKQLQQPTTVNHDNTQTTSLSSSIDHQTKTRYNVLKESTSKIEVLQQEGMNSLIAHTQTTHTQHVQVSCQ